MSKHRGGPDPRQEDFARSRRSHLPRIRQRISAVKYRFWRMKMPAIDMPAPNDYGAKYFGDEPRQRAARWLWDSLDDRQRLSFSVNSTFMVTGNETKRRYRISYNTVERIDNPAAQFCLVFKGGDLIPFEDWLLAKKILIECDEDLFLRTAHIHGAFPERR
jgi:hypothetical protein